MTPTGREIVPYTPPVEFDDFAAQLEADVRQALWGLAQQYHKKENLPLTPAGIAAAQRIVLTALRNELGPQDPLPTSERQIKRLVGQGLSARRRLQTQTAELTAKLEFKNRPWRQSLSDNLAIPSELITRAEKELKVFPLRSSHPAAAKLIELYQANTETVPALAAAVAYQTLGFARAADGAADPATFEQVKGLIPKVKHQARVNRGLVAQQTLILAESAAADRADPLLFPYALIGDLIEILASAKVNPQTLVSRSIEPLPFPDPTIVPPAKTVGLEYSRQLTRAAKNWRRSPLSSDLQNPRHWGKMEDTIGDLLPTVPLHQEFPLTVDANEFDPNRPHVWEQAVIIGDTAVPSLLDLHRAKMWQGQIPGRRNFAIVTRGSKAWIRLLTIRANTPRQIEALEAKRRAILGRLKDFPAAKTTDLNLSVNLPQNIQEALEEHYLNKDFRALVTRRRVLAKEAGKLARASRLQIDLKRLMKLESGQDRLMVNSFIDLRLEELTAQLRKTQARINLARNGIERPNWTAIGQKELSDPARQVPGSIAQIKAQMKTAGEFLAGFDKHPSRYLPDTDKTKILKFLGWYQDYYLSGPMLKQERNRRFQMARHILDSKNPNPIFKAEIRGWVVGDAWSRLEELRRLYQAELQEEAVKREQKVLTRCRAEDTIQPWYEFQARESGGSSGRVPRVGRLLRLRLLPDEVSADLLSLRKQVTEAKKLSSAYSQVAGHLTFKIPRPEVIQSVVQERIEKLEATPIEAQLAARAKKSGSIKLFLTALAKAAAEKNPFVPVAEAGDFSLAGFISVVRARTAAARAVLESEQIRGQIADIDRELGPLKGERDAIERRKQAQIYSGRIRSLVQELNSAETDFLATMTHLGLAIPAERLKKVL